MVEEDLVLEKPIEINLKKLKLKKKLKKYKIPIVLGLIGLIFIIIGGYLLTKSEKVKSNVEIISADLPTGRQVAQKEIVVDVSGAVFKPGVYKLSDGSRLQEALVMAGGLSNEADRDWVEKNLNLAIKLTDGNKIYIPKIGESSETEVVNRQINVAGQVAGTTTGLINVNTASMAELDTLPGVGEKTAEKIISGRQYSKIEDLVDKKIVGKAVFEKIKEKISI